MLFKAHSSYCCWPTSWTDLSHTWLDQEKHWCSASSLSFAISVRGSDCFALGISRTSSRLCQSSRWLCFQRCMCCRPTCSDPMVLQVPRSQLEASHFHDGLYQELFDQPIRESDSQSFNLLPAGQSFPLSFHLWLPLVCFEAWLLDMYCYDMRSKVNLPTFEHR